MKYWEITADNLSKAGYQRRERHVLCLQLFGYEFSCTCRVALGLRGNTDFSLLHFEPLPLSDSGDDSMN